MDKKIRHLEYYGYADQNVYMGIPNNVDLSDIREVNKEQDKEINAISGATKDKADLTIVNELSGKVETFTDRQSLINMWLAKGVNKNRERIDNLEGRDEEITNKINEIVDDFNPIYDELEEVTTQVNNIDNRLTRHLEEESTFEVETNQRLNFLETNVDKKIDRTEAYDTFANKNDVYTKNEVDNLVEHGIEGYATEQWVLNQGYIKETDANSRFATKSKVNALEDRVNGIQTSVYEIGGDLSQFKSVTNNKIDALDGRLGTLEVKHDRDIANLQNEDCELREDIDRNSNDIYQINNVALPNKANKSDLDSLSSRVDILSIGLNNKVDKVDYARDQSLIEVELNDIRDKKADKTQLNAVSGAVNSLNTKLDREIQNRIDGDNYLSSKISSANTRIDNIREENVGRDRKIRDLEYGLSAETRAREQAIINVIGTPSDIDEDKTIYGAKAYADKVANQALGAAKVYAENGDRNILDYVDETKANLERQITAKADKSYVDAVKGEIQISIDDKVAIEKNRAELVESSLSSAIRQETQRAINKETIISSALTHTSNVVHALTDWDGDDRIDYSDAGNGIVDVMHREMHDVKEMISAITIIGEGIKTSNPHEVSFGTYNVTNTGFYDSEKTMFSIGVGDSEVGRKNAIEIRKNGDIYMWVEGEFMKVNDLLSMLAHETY